MSDKIIMLIEDLFEDIEAVYPYYRLVEQGYDVTLVGPEGGKMYKGKHGMALKSDKASGEVNPEDFTGLVIPGGYAPDRMVRDKNMVDLVRDSVNKCCIIAAICHGPLMLVEADIIKNKKVTGFKSILTPLRLAGAKVMDDSVVTDENIITARDASDVIEFSKAIIEMLAAYSK